MTSTGRWTTCQRGSCPGRRRESGIFQRQRNLLKTRWEPSIEGSNIALPDARLLQRDACKCRNRSCRSPTWTGLWRDPRFSPPADGTAGNSLSGTIFAVECASKRPDQRAQADGRMRFWRNTSMATLGPGQVATLPTGVLAMSGYRR